MDNICHTLVGAAMAEAGLKRRTALGSATLMIAANFPDVDVLAGQGEAVADQRGALGAAVGDVVMYVLKLEVQIVGNDGRRTDHTLHYNI